MGAKDAPSLIPFPAIHKQNSAADPVVESLTISRSHSRRGSESSWHNRIKRKNSHPFTTAASNPKDGPEMSSRLPQNSWRRFVPSWGNIGGILLALSTVLGFILFMALGKYLAIPLTQLSNFVKAQGKWGYAIMAGLVFLTSFPPIIGYGIMQVLNGFIFGIWRGFLISWVSALVGATFSFLLCRYILRDLVYRKAASHAYFAAICYSLQPPLPEHSESGRKKRRFTGTSPLLSAKNSGSGNSICTTASSESIYSVKHHHDSSIFISSQRRNSEVHGRPSTASPLALAPIVPASEARKQQISSFFLIVLIRLAPFPFNLFNLMLSSTPISLPRFIAATGIANIKIFLDVIIGANVSNIGEIVNDPTNSKSKWIKTVPIAIAVILATLAIVVVGVVVKKRLKVIQAAIDKEKAESAAAAAIVAEPDDGTAENERHKFDQVAENELGSEGDMNSVIIQR